MIPLTIEEALARLSEADPMQMMIDRVPNNGFTHVQSVTRAFVLERLRKNQPFESGASAQAQDFGLNIITIASPTGRLQDTSMCMIFFPTKPECRLTAEQLDESLERKRGADIFSKPPTTLTE